MEKRKQTQQVQQNKSVHERHPILTAHLTNKTTTKGQTDPIAPRVGSSSSSSSNKSVKRAHQSHEAPQGKRPRAAAAAAVDTTRNIFLSMARDIEALADDQSDNDTIPTDESLENWCLSKTIALMNRYKSKDS